MTGERLSEQELERYLTERHLSYVCASFLIHHIKEQGVLKVDGERIAFVPEEGTFEFLN